MIRWEEQPALPPGVAAVLTSLQPGGRLPANLSDTAWEEALKFSDRFQLTLLLRLPFPAWVEERIHHDRDRNRQRMAQILQAFREVTQVAARIELAVLKGFAHWDLFHICPADRVQYDLDLFSPEALKIRGALHQLGYKPRETELTLARESNWKWNGDFYDPAIPIAIDLHVSLWDHAMEGFVVSGLEDFWQRRVRREVEGTSYWTLAPADSLAFAVLHMIRHLLHGDARPAQVYEVASFLTNHTSDDTFWQSWLALHPPQLRAFEAIGFRLAEEWFGCPLHAAAQEEVRRLAPEIRHWFDRFAASPLTSFYRPNKDELVLNLCLLESTAAKARIVRRRLFPARLPKPFSYAVERGLFHLRALVPAVSTMLKIRR